jgi:hypothetical protein
LDIFEHLEQAEGIVLEIQGMVSEILADPCKPEVV